VIAGGEEAFVRAREGAEDDPSAGAEALRARQLCAGDCVVGVAASGRTPFVLGALRFAREHAASAVGLCNVRPSKLAEWSDVVIAPLVGPEVVAGSTRMKAGTSQKLVLNMLSTTAMVALGKTYGSLMVDLRATNAKLRARAVRIVRLATGADESEARAALLQSEGRVKTAIVMVLAGISASAADERLAGHGSVRQALAR
jgi:N-acetylmuramic acid 6-phosphate etherase